MALPTSGPLSLSDIQTEFGGSNPISLSEYYAGGAYVLAGTTGTYGAVPSSGAISIQNFYGTTAALDTQTVTVGTYIDKYNYASGYSTFLGIGAVSDGSFNPKGGAAIQVLMHNNGTVFFQIQGNQTNAGWTTMTVAGTPYTRASASFTTTTGGSAYASWSWTSATNPFVGATVQAVFT